MLAEIRVSDSRINNLKGISCSFPHGELSVVCGPSGSGKFSLLFGTIYTYYQTHIRNSISSHKHDTTSGYVHKVTGLSHVIALPFMQTPGAKSNIGNYSRLHDPLRFLLETHATKYSNVLQLNKFDKSIANNFLAQRTSEQLILFADFERREQKAIPHFVEKWAKLGFETFLINSQVYSLEDLEDCFLSKSQFGPDLNPLTAVLLDYFPAQLESVSRFEETVKLARSHNLPELLLTRANSIWDPLSLDLAVDAKTELPNFEQVSKMSVREIFSILKSDFHTEDPVVNLCQERCQTLTELGLEYLELNRPISSLSAGEFQRLRLAKAMELPFANTAYLLEHPTAGLHRAEIDRVCCALKKLIAKGNTVLCITHDRAIIDMSKHVLYLGPERGEKGGRLEPSSTQPTSKPHIISRILKTNECSTTNWLQFTLREWRYLRKMNLRIPLGMLSTVVGVSGSGKTSLLRFAVYPAITKLISQNAGQCADRALDPSGPVYRVEGHEQIRQIKALWRLTSTERFRSTVGQLSGIDQLIRSRYALTPRAKMNGYGPDYFSAKSHQGKCPKCHGLGRARWPIKSIKRNSKVNSGPAICAYCFGSGIRSEISSIDCHGLSFNKALQLTITETKQVFGKIPRLRTIADQMIDAGLGHLQLGHQLRLMSPSEVQRLRLARAITPVSLIGTLLLLDEPVAGMDDFEVQHFLNLVDLALKKGATILTSEHNIKVIRSSDYLVELGPGAGADGGRLVACGTPQTMADAPQSIIGRYIRYSRDFEQQEDVSS